MPSTVNATASSASQSSGAVSVNVSPASVRESVSVSALHESDQSSSASAYRPGSNDHPPPSGSNRPTRNPPSASYNSKHGLHGHASLDAVLAELVALLLTPSGG